jgi:hypothetical protein
LANDDITNRFLKMAKKLKRIAPKAQDFLYGHAIMMHAAEAALINQETGEPILGSDGKPILHHLKHLRQKMAKIGNNDGTKPLRITSPPDDVYKLCIRQV